MPGILNVKQGQPYQRPVQVLSGDGAIAISDGLVYITKGSAAAITLAAPLADGYELEVISTTAFAHTLTQTTPGFNNGGTASDVGTFAAAVGNSIKLRSYNGVWWVANNVNVTLA